jgi:FkbM family methyltransferase
MDIKNFKSMITDARVDSLHHKFYREAINNNNGINPNVVIKATQEKVYVGQFLFVINKNDTCVSDSLRTGILFEKFILSYIKQFIDPTKNILDIGANIGVHSIVYSTYTTGTVYAFEPQPVVFELLERNIESNNCNNIIPYNFGASDKDAVYFMNAGYDKKNNQGAFRICKKSGIGIDIECKVLDNLHLSNIGYIKIDVEGHELNTLLGLEHTIRSNLPNLLIEIHDTSDTKYNVLKFINELGYKKYYKLTRCDYVFTF